MKINEFGEDCFNETIRKVKGGYRLVSKSGKNLGTYPTHSGAEKREKQVQYFKHMEEAPQQQQPPLPIDLNKINNLIDKLESRGVSPEDADKMRREIQLLATPRQSMHPEAILQLLTILAG
jgi:hypothetical protein